MMDLEEVDIDEAMVQCIKQIRDMKTNIEDLEESIRDIEHNEEVLSDTLIRLRNDPVLSYEIQKALDEYKKTTDIVEIRKKLHDLYDKRQTISSTMKLAMVTVSSADDLTSYVCPICFERRIARFISVCGHTFCVHCISSNHRSTCPMCRTHYDITQVKNLIYSS